MIDPTTGPLITHHKAVLSFMSQQLQPLRKEWDGEREGKKTRHNKEINELKTLFKGAECGRLVSQLNYFIEVRSEFFTLSYCSFLLQPFHNFLKVKEIILWQFQWYFLLNSLDILEKLLKCVSVSVIQLQSCLFKKKKEIPQRMGFF